MDLEILKSYLVDLGFAVNQPELAKFEGTLQQAASSVTAHTGGIAKDIFKWQGSITALFTGVSAAVIAAADHVAQSDQRYRLMGLRMFMTTESARKLQVGLDTLGASLEEIAWDPELNKRFAQLSADQDKLARGLGSNFSADMRGVRDLRFEFSRLHVALEYLSMRVVSGLFESFGTTVGGVREKLRALVEWVTANLPAIGDAIAKQLLPILQQTGTILKELGEALGETAVLFSNFVGLLSGDRAIEGTVLDFEKLAGAIGHVIGFLGSMLHVLTTAEKMLVHFADAAVLAVSGKFSEAKEELGKAMSELGPNVGGLVGGVVGTMIAPGVGTGIGMMAGAALGRAKQAVAPTDDRVGLTVKTPELPHVADAGPSSFAPMPTGEGFRELPPITIENQVERAPYTPPKADGVTTAPRGEIGQTIVREAQRDGIDPRVALAVAQQESGQHQFKKDGSLVSSGKAIGVMQLTPVTAKEMRVDPRDTQQNIQGGVAYLAQQLKRYHNDLPKALAAYNMGPNGYDRALARHQALPAETTNYVRSIMGSLRAGGSTVTVGDVHVSVSQPNATPQQIQAAVTQGVAAAVARQTQRTLAQAPYLG